MKIFRYPDAYLVIQFHEFAGMDYRQLYKAIINSEFHSMTATSRGIETLYLHIFYLELLYVSNKV